VSRSLSPPEFFIDRSLGRHVVAAQLRVAGWSVQTHHDVYGSEDESIPDTRWLEHCGDTGLAVLTKDRRLRYRPAEADAIRHFGIKAFVLTRGNLTAAQQAQRFLDNENRILEACDQEGPFLFIVHATRLLPVAM
jgi:PIN like domain